MHSCLLGEYGENATTCTEFYIASGISAILLVMVLVQGVFLTVCAFCLRKKNRIIKRLQGHSREEKKGMKETCVFLLLMCAHLHHYELFTFLEILKAMMMLNQNIKSEFSFC